MAPPLTNRVIVAKGALVDLLAAVTGLEDRVTWGVPRERRGRESVIVGDVIGDQRAVSVGRGASSRRAETFTIDVVVIVTASGLDTPRATSTRCFELVDLIDGAVRAAPELGLSTADGVYVAEISKTDLREVVGDGIERQSIAVVSVRVTTRI